MFIASFARDGDTAHDIEALPQRLIDLDRRLVYSLSQHARGGYGAVPEKVERYYLRMAPLDNPKAFQELSQGLTPRKVAAEVWLKVLTCVSAHVGFTVTPGIEPEVVILEAVDQFWTDDCPKLFRAIEGVVAQLGDGEVMVPGARYAPKGATS